MIIKKMKYNLLILYSFLLFINIFQFSISHLLFPFKTHQSTIKNTEENITLLFMSLIDNHIFINLEIGEPKQNIEAFLRMDTYDFYISQKPQNDTNNPYIINYDSDLSKFYDKNNSNSLEITDILIDNYFGSGNEANDYIYFTNNEKKIIKERLPFILYNLTLLNISSVIGLDNVLDEEYKKYNFIDKLKENDIIDSYFWMINYTSNYEGNLMIGEFPHIIDPLNFKEENLVMYYPFLEDTTFGWGLTFDKINFGEKYFQQYYDFFITYEINYIKGIIELEKELDKYFKESIDNGICFKKVFNYKEGPKKFFYCNKDKYKDNIKLFPKLEFFQFDFNYTFELDYKDLFVEKDDKLILLIFFDDALFDWQFGKPFLRKYSFLMNQDTNILYFYKNNHNNNENNGGHNNGGNNNNNVDNNNNDYIVLKIIFIIIGIIILLVLGIFIGKYII